LLLFARLYSTLEDSKQFIFNGLWFDYDPLRKPLLPAMAQAPYKKHANRSLCQARRLGGYASPPLPFSPCAAQPAYRLTYGPIDGLVAETLQETAQRREGGHTRQPQHLPQFTVLAQAHLGLAKVPVLVAHQTEDGQQLRLRELVCLLKRLR